MTLLAIKTLPSFKEYFPNLSNFGNNFENEEAEEFCKNYENNNECNTVFPELDRPIDLNEIGKAIKNLKRNKAFGSDCLINEYFIECSDILSVHLCDIFNILIVF